jgi:hypothetical protein
MNTEQEQRLHVRERERVGGQRGALSDTWSATLAKPKPSHLSHLTLSQVLLLSCASQRRVPGCGTGRLRRRERSEWERARRASGGGAA